MRGQPSSAVRLTLAILLGPFLLLSWLATTTSSNEVKLPPLRVKVGEKAPDFALPSATGKIVRLSDFSEHNVLIDFCRGYW